MQTILNAVPDDTKLSFSRVARKRAGLYRKLPLSAWPEGLWERTRNRKRQRPQRELASRWHALTPCGTPSLAVSRSLRPSVRSPLNHLGRRRLQLRVPCIRLCHLPPRRVYMAAGTNGSLGSSKRAATSTCRCSGNSTISDWLPCRRWHRRGRAILRSGKDNTSPKRERGNRHKPKAPAREVLATRHPLLRWRFRLVSDRPALSIDERPRSLVLESVSSSGGCRVVTRRASACTFGSPCRRSRRWR